MYDAALHRFKSSFRGDTECDVWVAELTSRVAAGPVSLLDIGVGDGVAISRRCDLLAERSVEVRLTGIDPWLPERVVAPPGSVLVRTGFADYRPREQFDVVNATHALYYLGDVAKAVRRIVAMTRPGGLVLLTTWTQDCILCRLFAECFADAPARVLTAERVRRALVAADGVEDVVLARSQGGVDLGRWASDDHCLDSAATVISRSTVPGPVSPERRARLASALHRYAPIEQRVNGIVVGRRTN